MRMRGLVLSGGTGSRLRPLTFTSAKQLIPVANKPVLFYVLEDLARAGVEEIGIVIAPQTGDEIREAVGDGTRFGAKVTYIMQTEPNGLAHAVLTAEEYLRGEPFCMYLGDNLLLEGMGTLVEEFERDHPNAMILLAKVDEPQQFGVAELDGSGGVVRLVEKPKDPPSDLALVGVYLFDENVFDAARSIKPSWRGELEITEAIQLLIERGMDVRSQVVQGYWKDLGKVEDLLAGNSQVLDGIEPHVDGEVDDESVVQGRVIIEADAKVVRSRIRGPAVVGRGAQITDSYIGPYTSVGDECVVESSEVEHSILLPEARLVGVRRVADSLLGRGAEVVRGTGSPVAHRLVIGDRSSVSVVQP